MTTITLGPAPCACQRRECVLCEARLLSELSAEQYCEIHGMRVRESYRPHDILLRQGEPSNYLFALKGGQVKLTVLSPSGREQILGVRVGGQLLGFGAMHDDTYPYTAEALTEVQVCRVGRKDILKALEQNPAVSLRIIERLNQELGQAQALIRDLGLKSAREKVASFILSLVPGPSVQTDVIPMPLSRRDVSEMLGLSIETVSRTFTKLQREGLIRSLRGQIQILEPMRLRIVAGEIVALNGYGRRALHAG